MLKVLSDKSGEKDPIINFNVLEQKKRDAPATTKPKRVKSMIPQQQKFVNALSRSSVNDASDSPDMDSQSFHSYQNRESTLCHNNTIPVPNDSYDRYRMLRQKLLASQDKPKKSPLKKISHEEEKVIYSQAQTNCWEDAIIWKSPSNNNTSMEVDAPPTIDTSNSYEMLDIPEDQLMSMNGKHRWELVPKASAPLSTTTGSKLERKPFNHELDSGKWLSYIEWEASPMVLTSNVVLDPNDDKLLFTDANDADARPTLRIPKKKIGAAEEKRAQLELQALQKKKRIDAVKGNLEFGDRTAESRLGTEAKKSKDTRVLKNIDHVPHSLPAIKLGMTKPELPTVRYRNFHRPVGKFKKNESILFSTMPKEKHSLDESTSLVVAPIKKGSDLNPSNGKLLFVEYSEQCPPILSNPGMVSKILHYWRPPDAESANAQPPTVENGSMIVLGSNEETPFVGEVPPGRVVASLNSKLFKAPIFKHRPAGNIYLIARRVPKSKKGETPRSTFHVTKVPEVYLAGQTEPQMEVPAPNSRSANEFIRPYMSFHILRLFKKANDGERLKIDDIHNAFPSQSQTAIRKRMKELATFERGGNDSGWWKRKIGAKFKTEDEMRASITPDSVCLYESMMSGHQKLRDVGLVKISSVVGIEASISFMIKRLEVRREQLSSTLDANLADREKDRELSKLLSQDQLYKKLEKDIQVARYIHEKLELTPWNLTNNYVVCHLQGKASGMLKLGGIGDPTGRGEGFSFVRIPQSRAKNAKKTDDANEASESASQTRVDNAVAAVTGTTSDLRKLKMKEAGDVLKNLGVPEGDIKKLKRWDRVGLIRDLCNHATAHGVAGTLSKFARGARKSLNSQQQEYRRRCDVIYKRQLEVLSSEKTEFSSDEEDEDIDFDELEKDLEDDILGATSTKDHIGSGRGPKNLFSKGGGGLNRSKAALAEREDEVELRRLMEDFNEAPSKSKGAAAAVATSSTTAASSSGKASESGRAATPAVVMEEKPDVPKRQVLRRVIRTIQEDGSETTRVEFVLEQSEVELYKQRLAKKERQRSKKGHRKKRRRSSTFALDGEELSAEKKQKLLENQLEQLTKTEEQNKDYQELLKQQGEQGLQAKSGSRGMVKCKNCHQYGHIKTNRNCPMYSATMKTPQQRRPSDLAFNDDIIRTEDDPLKLKIKKSAVATKCTVNLSQLQEGQRKHQELQKRKKLQEAKDQAELYKRPSAIIKSKKLQRVRMPICHLNAYFEDVLYRLMTLEESAFFLEAVDGEKFTDYYTHITDPMDLTRMRLKVENFRYSKRKEFIADVETIVKNSTIYNGQAHIVTSQANQLLVSCKQALDDMAAEVDISKLETRVAEAKDLPVSMEKRKRSLK